jgi:hypothetical protein
LSFVSISVRSGYITRASTIVSSTKAHRLEPRVHLLQRRHVELDDVVARDVHGCDAVTVGADHTALLDLRAEPRLGALGVLRDVEELLALDVVEVERCGVRVVTTYDASSALLDSVEPEPPLQPKLLRVLTSGRRGAGTRRGAEPMQTVIGRERFLALLTAQHQ